MTERWFEIPRLAVEHPVQSRLLQDLKTHRYTNYLVAAGRRSFKTERFIKRFSIYEAIKYSNYHIILGAPTFAQARRILWKDILEMIPDGAIYTVSKADLVITLKNKSTLTFFGLLEYSRIEGQMFHAGFITEFQQCNPEVYYQTLEPIINDTNGILVMEGRPFGKNHFFEFFQKAYTEPMWQNYTWESADILSPQQIEAAKRNIPLADYQREYEASFDVNTATAYHAYTPDNLKVPPNMRLSSVLPIIITCDFNATEKPMSWIIAQKKENKLYIHEAISIQFTNTRTMCSVLKNRLKEYHLPNIQSLRLFFYGDFAGNHRTSNSSYTDWEIIEQEFRNAKQFQTFLRPCKSIRDSVEATNHMLSNALGEVFTYINESLCEPLIKDFQMVEWKDNSRELNEPTPLRGHSNRALDYYNYYENPVYGQTQTKVA